MPNWNTEKIMKELKNSIPNIKQITNVGPGGDYDTENIHITFKKTEDRLSIYGFNVESECTTPGNIEVEYVAITDGLDSRGGLNSENHNMGLAFIEVRKYFIDNKFKIANTIDDFF